jgi:hypothetical protein
MTRGKHGQVADRRRENTAVNDDISALRREHVRLRGELVAARANIETTKAQHAERVRVLVAERDEGVSAELTAARELLREAQDEIGRLRASSAEIHDRWEKFTSRLMTYLRTTMPEIDVWETMLRLSGKVDFGGVIEDENQRKLGAAGVKAVQRARGMRR